VRANLLYGRRFAKASAGAPDFAAVVDMLGIGPLLSRRPADLSGGEEQRVAIGRALLAGPRLLLMDEPLASLDDARKSEILPFIERLRDEQQVPIVYVTHSVAEIARLADTVVVLSAGRVQAVGPVSEVLVRPGFDAGLERSEAGGRLMARVKRHDPDGLTVLEVRAGDIYVPQVEAAIGTLVRVHIHARDVILALTRPEGLSALNILPAVVHAVGAESGAAVDVVLDLQGERLLARITSRSLEALQIGPGRLVYAVLKSVAVDRDDIGYMERHTA
jgi:molybdate transport system ATP-binding protein